MSNSLLPPSASNFMRCAEAVGTRITDIPVDLNTLWSPDTCPVHLLPYLAWAFSVDRWDRNWPEETKRQVIRDAWLIHRHKGTISALRRAVEPLGYLIEVKEWWQLNEEPGTFRIVVGVLDQGITNEMYQELERLIAGCKTSKSPSDGAGDQPECERKDFRWYGMLSRRCPDGLSLHPGVHYCRRGLFPCPGHSFN
ncbi:Tail protein I [Escherichia coli]|nr:Tail protein I [Escherichia coli]